MGEVVIAVAKWTFKATFFLTLVVALMVVFGIMSSYLVVAYNTSVLNDLFGLIQIWLPFNLNVLLIWIVLSSSAYIAYRIAHMMYEIVSNYIGK